MDWAEIKEALKKFANKYAARVGIFLLCAAVMAYVLYHCLDIGSVRIETAHAVESTEYEIAGLTGYIFRDEHIVTSTNSGAAIYRVSDGEKVSVGTELARVYTSGSTAEYVSRRDAIENDIELLQRSIAMKSAAASIAKTNEAIDRAYSSLMAAIAREDAEATRHWSEELAIYLNAYDYVIGKTDLDAALAEKKAELAALADSYSGVYDSVVCEKSGYFCYGADGYEDIFNYSSAESLTRAELSEMIGKMKTAGTGTDGTVGRMIYDFEWYLAVPATAELCEKMSEAAGYEITFTSSHMKLTMTLDRIAILPGEAEGLLVFVSGEHPEDFDFGREQGIEILVDTTVGYRVPREALREHKGFKGVYIIAASEIKFRRVNILLETDGYYVVAERDLSTENYSEFLDLNDEVIISISDGELYDGRLLN